MKKLYIIHSIDGLSYEEFLKTTDLIKYRVEKLIGETIELVELIEKADIVFLAEDWKKTDFCKLEYETAKKNKLEIIKEKTWTINISWIQIFYTIIFIIALLLIFCKLF